MTNEEKALWSERLDERSRRFAKLVALHAPSYVLCSDLMLLVKAVVCLYPETYGQVMAESLRKAARREHGLCVFCGAFNEGRNAAGEDWCETCEASAKAECEADDARPDGDK